jgi:hypothetical protein
LIHINALAVSERIFAFALARRNSMRNKLTALLLAGALVGALSQSAKAIPIDAAGISAATAAASSVEKAHWHHRHGFVKCYYDLVIGPYVCHHFHHW